MKDSVKQSAMDFFMEDSVKDSVIDSVRIM